MSDIVESKLSSEQVASVCSMAKFCADVTIEQAGTRLRTHRSPLVHLPISLAAAVHHVHFSPRQVRWQHLGNSSGTRHMSSGFSAHSGQANRSGQDMVRAAVTGDWVVTSSLYLQLLQACLLKHNSYYAAQDSCRKDLSCRKSQLDAPSACWAA